MCKTFVYNTGNPLPDSPETLKLTYGVFFDGTLNNRENTEIRKKVEKKGEFRMISASEEELRIYKKYAKEDNSFGNDFTNVARKWYCTEEEYRVYIEGIGTIDKEDDVGGGYKYGRGTTGVVGKVRNGCKALAEKIALKANSNYRLEEIVLTLDIFGFSRGSAAARNFAYNLQMNPYAPRSYYPPVQGAQRIELDHEESESFAIEKSWVQDGKLPKFGHLGTALLQAGISPELVDSMTVIVRFIGIYDTVASYDPTCLLLPSFKKKIKQLHLHEIGSPKKAVHFTAADEHRENFSLTRFSKVELRTGIERNFPGVHSDIGGSYNHDALASAEFSTESIQPDPIKGVSEKEKIDLQVTYTKGGSQSLHDELIVEGWYKKEQLTVDPRFNYVLCGRRYLYRGYSFIPLHFMCDYALPYLNEEGKSDLKYQKLMTDYALNDEFLDKVKSYLQEHCIEKNENWGLKGKHFLPEDNKEEVTVLSAEPNSNEPIYDEGDINEVVVIGYRSNYLLRRLRNRYLHRSAKYNSAADYFANAPTDDRKRMEF